MKLNRKFFKKVQREFKPRRSIQFIRDCYKNGGVLHEDDTFDLTKVVIPEDLTSQLYILAQSPNFKGIPE